MSVVVLQSGSNGNCIYVEAADVRLLIDAGISGSMARNRLAGVGIDISKVNALLISHEHGDHVRSLGVYHRQFSLPVYVTKMTLSAARTRFNLGRLGELRTFCSGETLTIGGLRIETLPTAHDAADGVAFVLDDGQRRLGIMTDLGHVFDGLGATVETLDAVLIESNYDPQMLSLSRYPERLKARIRGPHGHLSNDEAAELLRTAGRRLQWACLGHLSQESNTPQVARQTHQRFLDDQLALHVASRYEASEVLHVE